MFIITSSVQYVSHEIIIKAMLRSPKDSLIPEASRLNFSSLTLDNSTNNTHFQYSLFDATSQLAVKVVLINFAHGLVSTCVSSTFFASLNMNLYEFSGSRKKGNDLDKVSLKHRINLPCFD